MSENKRTIKVRVQDIAGQDPAVRPAMVVNAQVKLFTVQQGGPVLVKTVATDPDGLAVFEDIPQGIYRVEATAFGPPITKDNIEMTDCHSREISVEMPVGLNFQVVSCGETKDRPCSDLYTACSPVKLDASVTNAPPKDMDVEYIFRVRQGRFVENGADRFVVKGKGLEKARAHLDTSSAGATGWRLHPDVTFAQVGGASITQGRVLNIAAQAAQPITGNVAVTMRRTATKATPDLPLWVVIRKSTEALSFDRYMEFLNLVLCGLEPGGDRLIHETQELKNRRLQRREHAVMESLRRRRFLPYNDADAYRVLKAATEAFVLVNCGIKSSNLAQFQFTQADVDDLVESVGVDGVFTLNTLQDLWTGDRSRHVEGYLTAVHDVQTILYLRLIQEKLKDVRMKRALFGEENDLEVPEECFGILETKLTNPCLLELIWSYWHEEGMLVQTMNAITLRFQNRRLSDRDPLANMEIDPLRPLNNLLWGYIQDEQHRLTLPRRSYEYDHHYGLRLEGRALPEGRTADSRSKFIEAFHNLLHLCSVFFKQDDDTTFIADGFPVLNALREVHRILAEGAHNQFGDLPSTARIEMLMQQWLLARPEFREYLPTRIMVAYPEPWMDRVDAMKKLQTWTDSSVADFSLLGTFGEQILLTIRYGSWSEVNDRENAANWARYWRSEIQGYIHSYRAVTGVDLTSEFTETRLNREAYLAPSVHLRRRLEAQIGPPPAALTAPKAAPARGTQPAPSRTRKEYV